MARILVVVLLGGILGAALVRISPGFGVDEQELDLRLSKQSIQAVRQQHADEAKFLVFCAHHFSRLLRGDLGVSRTFERPISMLLRERTPETAKGVGLALALGWSFGLTMAMLVVLSRSWSVDLTASLVSGFLMCLPAAVLGLLFVLAQAPARLVLALIVLPNVFRYSRNLLVRSASQPHVLMAQAKGLGSARILFRHILLPVAPQLLALAGVSVSLALTAAIPVEALCDLPGLGQLAWKAALGRDLYLLVNLTMIVTVVTLLANSASDVFTRTLRGNPA
ncbi:MAG TPA: ABC transporter permease [Terriglobales bacterium]|nr:ABC transporter permease [Terriglobales bacterium]